MHRPTRRHDALRQRVFAGRERQNAKQRRVAVARKGGRRAIAIGAGLAMVAGVLTVTQLASSALDNNESGLGANGACEETDVVVESSTDDDLEVHVEEEDGVWHHHYRKKNGGSSPPADPDCDEDGSGDGDGSGGEGSGGEGDGDGDGSDGDGDGDGSDGDGSGDGNGSGDGTNAGSVPPGGADGNNNGLNVIGRDCTISNLPPHLGFQAEEAQCASTQIGEISAVQNNPTLLITDSPDWVQVDEPFTVTVSTRNLERSRFLGAGDGGYYIEASYLNDDGIQTGHFHFGCTELVDGNQAQDPLNLLNPGFFAAVEDGGGGAGVDFVNVEVPGLSDPGMYQCMAWAGDGSHRVPTMSFARQFIAVDTFRLAVTDGTESE